MIPLKVTFHPFVHELNRPLILQNTPITNRQGVFIKLETLSLSPIISWGEISPLPFFHKEKLVDILSSLYENYLLMTNLVLIPQQFHLTTPFFNLFPKEIHNEIYHSPLFNLPSFRFGLEQALWHLFWQIKDNSPFKVPLSFKRNALLYSSDFSSKNALDTCQYIHENNYQVIKIKLGFDTIENEIKNIYSTLKKMDSIPLIRLDGNERLHYFDFEKLVDLLKEYPIPLDYVEDAPFSLPLPLGLDHLLSKINLKDSLPPHLKSLIIRPTMMGLSHSFQLIEWAQSQNIPTIFSSTIDSRYTLSTLAFLASFFGEQQEAHGLDTERFLKNDSTSWQIKGARGTPTLMDLPWNIQFSLQINGQFQSEILGI